MDEDTLSSLFYSTSNRLDTKAVISLYMQDLQALAVYVAAHLNKPGVSTHSVAKNSGGGLSHGTVWNIANNNVREVKERTLLALARGLGVAYEEIQGIVKGKPVEIAAPLQALEIYFHGWDEVTPADRRATLDALQLIGEAFQARRRLAQSGRQTVKIVTPGRDRRRTSKAS